MRVAALIPHYDHAGTLPQVVAAMRAQGLPVLIVDDASPVACQPVLQRLVHEGAPSAGRGEAPPVQVLPLPVNLGKGGAVKAGLRWAHEQGFSHVLQVDADAQHQLADAERLLAAAQEKPDAAVCAEPVYGDDAPRSRLYGRKLTNFWAAVNTGSCQIRDGMCGFRLYPLVPVLRVLDTWPSGNRMEFDPQLLVYLVWAGVPLVWVRTPVRYEKGGVSHFAPWRDNFRISGMHARLFFMMLGRHLGLVRRTPRS